MKTKYSSVWERTCETRCPKPRFLSLTVNVPLPVIINGNQWLRFTNSLHPHSQAKRKMGSLFPSHSQKVEVERGWVTRLRSPGKIDHSTSFPEWQSALGDSACEAKPATQSYLAGNSTKSTGARVKPLRQQASPVLWTRRVSGWQEAWEEPTCLYGSQRRDSPCKHHTFL